MHPNDQHPRLDQPNIKICEAVGCYETATESIVVSAGKFGTVELNLCHRCAVSKFRTNVDAVNGQRILKP